MASPVCEREAAVRKGGPLAAEQVEQQCLHRDNILQCLFCRDHSGGCCFTATLEGLLWSWARRAKAGTTMALPFSAPLTTADQKRAPLRRNKLNNMLQNTTQRLNLAACRLRKASSMLPVHSGHNAGHKVAACHHISILSCKQLA